MSDETTESDLHWVELQLLLQERDPFAHELLDEALLAITPGGFAVEAWDAPKSERTAVPPGWLRYLIYVGEPEAEAAQVAIGLAVAATWPEARVSVSALPAGWRDRWKQYFKPIRVDGGLIVTPPWIEVTPEPGQRVLIVEPGMAFGTAQHETTALCLEGVSALYTTGVVYPRVLDVGAGTGILGIAAGMLGAQTIYGTDIDPQAVRAGVQNAGLNAAGLGHATLQFDTTPIERVAGEWDLVLANILTPTLILLAAPICARVRPDGGRLMLSGILAGEQAAEIVQAFTAQGVRHLGTAELRGWVRVDFVRDAAAAAQS